MPLLSRAQINILPQTGVPHILVNTFQEIGGAYYFLSYDSSVAAKDIFNNHPHQYLLNKIDKNTNSVMSAVVAMGDTLQVDSLISSYGIQMKKSPDNQICIFYRKQIKQDFSLPYYRQWKVGIYYVAFDTLLQPFVHDKRILAMDGYAQMYNPIPSVLSFVGDNSLLSYDLSDTGGSYYLSKYLKMDAQANILANDTMGVKAAMELPGAHQVGIIETAKNKVFVLGFQLLPPDNYNQMMSILVLDTSLSIVDTFRHDYYNGSQGFSYFEMNDCVVLLKSGTVIEGHASMNYAANGIHSVITRHQLNHPFQIDSYLPIYGKDTVDYSHSSGGKCDVIVHNEMDNLIYYANSTHSLDYETSCVGKNTNYIQIICADTNLNHKWTKYIYSGNNLCAIPYHVVPGYNRTGIVVCGSERTVPNNADAGAFAYYINSTGSLSVPNTEQAFIRDRFNVYPNPATSNVFVDDVFDKLKEQQSTQWMGA
ncbi:hypothetical protein DN068_09905 [Taibaiella soli]|uniref:Uncharacterized protein n=1 Tax=Taibaiella soli TaxID=1649169 RepID=A0A2W2ACM1_9BACT|nr:hypothetical protein DN068_09905 [Taibaiella soli]